ncbi:ABC transporter substrate-binding protein [Spirillospora sp. CA-294931]|uniref:ABC transporter substrate-binding protein n=1 Tax=Spirillospora sp. CA-294931 TaxID=3240042 RepID=UPI003D8E1C26
MKSSPSSHLSRRGLLTATGSLALGALIAGCGESEGAAKGGAWNFTDDFGTKVGLKERPRRIVAYIGAAAALHDFGVTDQIVGVFGPTKRKDGSPDVQAGGLPVDEVTILGNAYGEFNIEKYAALRPEVLISTSFVGKDLFYVPAESKDKIFRLAPQIGISGGSVPLNRPIERFAQLAAALGADTASAKVKQDRARFDRAAAAVRAAAKENPGITILAASAGTELLYASNPGKNTDLMYFKQLGAGVIVPDKIGKDGYFEDLSWENADKYKTDVVLLDNRSHAIQPKDLTSKPSWRGLPAVKAGQVAAWAPEPAFSYAGCAPVLEALAQTIRTAKKIT